MNFSALGVFVDRHKAIEKAVSLSVSPVEDAVLHELSDFLSCPATATRSALTSLRSLLRLARLEAATEQAILATFPSDFHQDTARAISKAVANAKDAQQRLQSLSLPR
jgi:hypothetical protein